jgi:tetratricopeptide (TPR) repeat protein
MPWGNEKNRVRPDPNVPQPRIIRENIQGIDPKACECMRSYIDGNRNLEDGEVSLAISLYDRALAAFVASAGGRGQTSRLPRGSILMKRARAYLRRAANHRSALRALVRDLSDAVPSASTVRVLYQAASTHPALSSSIFARLSCDSRGQQARFRQIRYRHDMYEFALLHAARDGLESTQVLPDNAGAWLLAGECLAELRKLKESNRYYQRALEIDPSMGERLVGVMEKNRASQEFLDVARASGFSGDTLRLAIDVAA